MRRRLPPSMLAAAMLALVAAPAAAEDAAATPPAAAEKPAPPAYRLDGSISAGYRNVDIDGSKDKYREDYNLRSGGRLFGIEMTGRATDPDAGLLDRFHLEVDTPHDEPVSHYLLTAGDTRRWDLRASWVRSKYFYEVPQLWQEPVAGDVRLDDLHDFDTTRSDGVVDLRVRFDNFTLLAGYRLYQRYGDSISTVYAPGGDTFLVRAPVDSTTNVGRLGAEFTALGTDVLLQQDYRHTDRSLDRQGPDGLGAAGVDPTDASTLTRYDVAQNEHIDSPTTLVRLHRQVGERTDLTGAYLYQHAELDASVASVLNASRNTLGFPTVQRTRGDAGASVDTHVADLAATVRVHERVQLHASYRYDAQQQNGDLSQLGTGGQLGVETSDHVRINRVTGEVEVEPRDDLRLRAGVRWAQKDTAFATGSGSASTTLVGAIADLRYRPLARLDLFARYENAQIDDPYTTAGAFAPPPSIPAREIRLTFVNRASTGFRYRPWDWAQLQYTFLADSRENGSFDASAHAYGNNVALSLEPRPNLSLYLAYTRRDLDSDAEIRTAPGYDVVGSVQQGSEDVVIAQLSYAFGLFGQQWTTGATVNYVDGSEKLAPAFEPGARTHTFFDLDRVDGGAFLTLRHPWIEPTLEFRMIDYNERVLPQNDYRATIVLVKFTKRWSR